MNTVMHPLNRMCLCGRTIYPATRSNGHQDAQVFPCCFESLQAAGATPKAHRALRRAHSTRWHRFKRNVETFLVASYTVGGVKSIFGGDR